MSQQESRYNEDRDRGIGHDVNYRRAHIVIAMCRAMGVFVLFKYDVIRAAVESERCHERVRLRYLVCGFQIGASVNKTEFLA